MVIGYVARYPHLLRHLQPVINELWNRGVEIREGFGDLTLCAARYDAETVLGPVVLVEHGAGQTYQVSGQTVDAGTIGKFSSPLTNVVLYVGPNQRLCDLYRTWLPNALMVVASPIIEWMRTIPRIPKLVTFAVHWPSPLATAVAEAGTSWPSSAWICKELKPDLIHAHPRIQHRIRRDMKQRKLTGSFVEDWDDVWPRTRLLVVDNSSILWEAAAVGIDVALIQPASWIGRHGLRFGIEADPLVRVTVENAQEVRGMMLPKPAGSPYEMIEGAAALVADAIQTLTL